MIRMEIHSDWKPLWSTFEEHYGAEAAIEELFNEFCEGKGINPEEAKPKGVFGYDWAGTILLEGDWREYAEELNLEAEAGMYLIGGRAIHPCKTVHPNEWPEVRIYLEAELAASAATAKGQPFWLDHVIEIGGANKILAARYTDGELQYVGQVEKHWRDLIESGDIKHISPGFEWTVLEKLDGIAPRGIKFYEFSLLKNLRPGDPTTTVELWEGLIEHSSAKFHEGAPYKPPGLSEFVEGELLKKRVLIFHGAVDQDICKEAAGRLEYMANLSKDPIKVILNSVGGGVFDGLLVFDTIKQLTESGIEVTCEARGLAASMGSIILQAATHRTATPHTRFLIHEVSSWAWGKASSIEEEAEEISKVNMLLKEILAERTGKTPAEIETIWRKKDVWMSAVEAEDFGLIDSIVSGMVEGVGAQLTENSFADYSSMEDCIAKNSGKDDPAAYCADICKQTEALCEAMGITMADWAGLSHDDRLLRVVDFFEGATHEADGFGLDRVLSDDELRNILRAYNESELFGVQFGMFPLAKTPEPLTGADAARMMELVWEFMVEGTTLVITIHEATAEQAREHHNLTQEEWDALSEEEKQEKMSSTPSTTEAKSLGEAMTGMFASAPDYAIIFCPECGTGIEKYEAEAWGVGVGAAGACYVCGHEFLPEDEVSYTDPDAIVAVVPFTQELFLIQKEGINNLHNTIKKLKLLQGEASLTPNLGPLEIPGYIRAEVVEGVLPSQMHHRAQPGHQRLVRQLRSLIKRSKGVN